MVDVALENAKTLRERVAKDRNEALARADELARQLSRIEQFIADYEAFASNSLPTTDPFSELHRIMAKRESQNAAREPAKRNRRNSKKEEVAAVGRELVSREGRPIPRPELYRRLTDEAGLTIEGSDPETVLSTMLWRTKELPGLVHLRSAGYWLAEVDYPDGGYFAALEELVGAADSDEPVAPDDYDDGDDE